MPRGRKGTGLTQKEKGNVETRSYSLELRLDELRSELAHVQGLVNVLRSEREMWRQRVIQAANGEVCSRCEKKIQPATPVPPPVPVLYTEPHGPPDQRPQTPRAVAPHG